MLFDLRYVLVIRRICLFTHNWSCLVILQYNTNTLSLVWNYQPLCSRYETKPALSVPIHVVELTNVPPELRMSAAVPEEEVARKTTPAEKPKAKHWVCITDSTNFFGEVVIATDVVYVI